MAFLNQIRNKFILLKIFSLTGEKIKFKLLKYNKTLQTRLDIEFFDYKKNIFYNTPEIKPDNLLSYYDYLKLAFKDIYPLEIIKNYYVEFFCRYLNQNNIIFELNCTHELTMDILLCEKLKKIKIVINIEDFKSCIIDHSKVDVNKRPFVKLFRVIFNNPKIIQFIILDNNNILKENENLDKSMFYNSLLQNLIYNFPSIKTSSLLLIEDLYNRNLEKNKFNSIELIVPVNSEIASYTYEHLKTIPIKFIHEKYAFDISSLSQINKFGIKNVHMKILINEDNSKKLYNMKIKINFKNIKKLELIFDKSEDDIYFSKSSNKINSYREKAFYEGNLLMNQLFYQNNYLKKIYDLYKKCFLGYIIYFKLLKELEKSKFEYLYIGQQSDFYFYYINKITNSIGLSLRVSYYNEKFFQKLSYYEDVKIRILTEKNLDNDDNNYYQEAKTINIFKYDSDSKIKHFSFRHKLKSFVYTNLENFPINFNNLISLELGFNICIGFNLIFPLFEQNCEFFFFNLQRLIIYIDIHCEKCLYSFPLDIFQNLGNNLKFCENLETLSISIDVIKSDIKDVISIINGLKILKYLREFNLIYSEEDYDIDEKKFYKYNPQYIKFFPFLNKIKMVLSYFTMSDLLYEKKIDYRINDIIIKDYKYIKTLGKSKSDSYITYLSSDKKDNKVVIRKFKKSRIKSSEECFENEKYCLKKFRQNPNVINYIEFLEDENYEYIVYEYIPNSRKYFNSKILARQIIILLYENIYKNSLKDKNILLFPINHSDILINNNFDIIIIGFGYLNLYNNDKYQNKKKLIKYYDIYNNYNEGFYLFHYLSNFDAYYDKDLNQEFHANNMYRKKGKEVEIKFDSLIHILKQKNEEYYRYKNSIKKYLPKFYINKEIIFESKCIVGKLFLRNNNIYILKSYMIEIYNEFNYNFENRIIVKKEDENSLYNLTTFDNNILICTDGMTVYVIYLEKNNNKIIQKYNINELKNKMHLNDNTIEFFSEIIKIRDTNYFLTSWNIICLWNMNKDLDFIKKYDNLKNTPIFEFKNNLAKYIGINNKKIIFFNISDNYDIIIYKEFDFNFKKSYRARKVVQNDENFFIVDNCQIIEFKTNLEKGTIITIFRHQYNLIPFFKYKYGIIGASYSSSAISYLSFKKKKNRKFKAIDIYLIADNEYIYDFQCKNNVIFILLGTKLLIVNFSI